MKIGLSLGKNLTTKNWD